MCKRATFQIFVMKPIMHINICTHMVYQNIMYYSNGENQRDTYMGSPYLTETFIL